MEGERRSRDDLLRLAHGLDESGDKGMDEGEEQKDKEKNDEALEGSRLDYNTGVCIRRWPRLRGLRWSCNGRYGRS